MLSFMPPFVQRPPDDFAPVIPQFPMQPFPQIAPVDDRAGLRARNRVAAQKWRRKKHSRMTEMESKNDDLRKQALDLGSRVQMLKAESRVLEEELAFFQQCMSRIMSAPK
jgi:hypothetical protein